MLKNGKLSLYAHTHPDYDSVIPSDDDRDFLKFIGQNSSIIVSWITGREFSFTTNKFDI
jgi:proteasome lid subunit RPN8/RPN11